MSPYWLRTRQIAMCATWAASLLAAAVTGHAQANVVRIGRLPPVNAREAWRGTISPDGRIFAYSVVLDHYRQIWLLDLETGRGRALTPTPSGSDAEFAWSPDSRRLAYVDHAASARKNVEIRVVVVDGDSDRVVHTFAAEQRRLRFDPGGGEAFDIHWLDARRIAVRYRHHVLDDARSDEWWRIPIDGGDSARIADSTSSAPHPIGGDRLCCGGGEIGLWLDATANRAPRCVAGPLPDGASSVMRDASGDAVLFTLHDQLYRADIRGGPAHRVRGDPAAFGEVSEASTGLLALTALAPGDSVAELWLMRPPFVVTSDTLPRCPEPSPRIMRFVHAQWPAARTVTQFGGRSADLHLFIAGIPRGPERSSDTRAGVQYHDRIGWLDTTAYRFVVRASDHALYRVMIDTIPFDTPSSSSRDHELRVVAKLWREYLAQQPTASADDLLALLTRDSSVGPIVAVNPVLATPSVSHETLLRLAMRSPAVAVVVLGLAPVRTDPVAIVAIARGARLWRDDSVSRATDSLLRELGPSIAQDPRSTEPVLFSLALATLGGPAALSALILEHPVVQRSARTLAVLALSAPGHDVAARAGERLSALGTTMPDEIVRIVQRAASERISPAAVRALIDAGAANAAIEQAGATLTDTAYVDVRGRARYHLTEAPLSRPPRSP